MTPETRKLYRSRNNRMLFGVCAGLANFFGIDPTHHAFNICSRYAIWIWLVYFHLHRAVYRGARRIARLTLSYSCAACAFHSE